MGRSGPRPSSGTRLSCPTRLGLLTHHSASGAAPPPAVVLAVSYAAGSVPFSGLAARLVAGVDLRNTGSGTVSGTGLYEVAGFAPLALAGSLDVAKGAVGPLAAGHKRPWLLAAASASTLVAHNWSPWLRGAGGRGISPALGATLVSAPEGTVLLLGGLAVGKLLHNTGLVSFIALALLAPVLERRRGREGLVLSLGVLAPMLVKRLAGNRPPPPGRRRPEVLVTRLLFDRDPR